MTPDSPAAPGGEAPRAIIRFYEELNDFLPEERRKRAYTVQFFQGETVKSVIENQGVPHTEVDLITVDSRSVPFTYQLREGDRVNVYPVFESFDITAISMVRPAPLRQLRFILDIHLGKLAKFLRMIGFDARWSPPFDDASLAERSRLEHRIILTRDRGLLKRKIVTHGYCVRSPNPEAQLREVLNRFDLFDSLSPFTRCMECNEELLPRKKEEIIERIPPKVRSLEEFKECPRCGNLYWKGTHWEQMRKKIERIIGTEKDER